MSGRKIILALIYRLLSVNFGLLRLELVRFWKVGNKPTTKKWDLCRC